MVVNTTILHSNILISPEWQNDFWDTNHVSCIQKQPYALEVYMVEIRVDVLREPMVAWLNQKNVKYHLKSTEPDPDGTYFTRKRRYAYEYCNSTPCKIVFENDDDSYALQFQLRW